MPESQSILQPTGSAYIQRWTISFPYIHFVVSGKLLRNSWRSAWYSSQFVAPSQFWTYSSRLAFSDSFWASRLCVSRSRASFCASILALRRLRASSAVAKWATLAASKRRRLDRSKFPTTSPKRSSKVRQVNFHKRSQPVRYISY